MQRFRPYLTLSDDGICPALTPVANSLTIDVEETVENRIQRLVSENPVVIFSRSSCCMCLVAKSLLTSVGGHPTVIELDEDEIPALASGGGGAIQGVAPAVFVGGACVGGLESVVALHLSGQLVPKLAEAGAL